MGASLILGALVGVIMGLTGAGGGILAVPLLVFGAGSLATGGASGLAFCGAASLVLLAIAPFAAGAAIREGRS